MGDFDELEQISDQNDVRGNYRARSGRKRGHGQRPTHKALSRGRFRRIKKKPITLAGPSVTSTTRDSP